MNDDIKANNQRHTAGLSVSKMASLFDDEFDALPKSERQRYFRAMAQGDYPPLAKFRKYAGIRRLTVEFYFSLLLGRWPSLAAVFDFGIRSGKHYMAMQEAVTVHEVSMEELDQAICSGAKLTALIGPENSCYGMKFTTPWDDANSWPRRAWEEDDDRPF